MASQLGDAVRVQGRGTGPELATRIAPKVFDGHLTEIDFSERHRPALSSGLGRVVDLVHKKGKSAARFNLAGSSELRSTGMMSCIVGNRILSEPAPAFRAIG